MYSKIDFKLYYGICVDCTADAYLYAVSSFSVYLISSPQLAKDHTDRIVH